MKFLFSAVSSSRFRNFVYLPVLSVSHQANGEKSLIFFNAVRNCNSLLLCCYVFMHVSFAVICSLDFTICNVIFAFA